jgi:hypothetical protein
MSRKKTSPMEVYVRHQAGHASMLTFHLNPEQRLQLIEALAAGRGVDMPAKLELSVLPQWLGNVVDDAPHAIIPLRLISFNDDSTR